MCLILTLTSDSTVDFMQSIHWPWSGIPNQLVVSVLVYDSMIDEIISLALLIDHGFPVAQNNTFD